MEKAPLESYADVGGLEQQVQEIKEAVELPLTHPELYEDIGIKPPKVSSPNEHSNWQCLLSHNCLVGSQGQCGLYMQYRESEGSTDALHGGCHANASTRVLIVRYAVY